MSGSEQNMSRELVVVENLSTNVQEVQSQVHELYIADRLSLAAEYYEQLTISVNEADLLRIHQSNAWIDVLLNDVKHFQYIVGSLQGDESWTETDNSNDIRVLYRKCPEEDAKTSGVYEIALHADFYCDMEDLVTVLNESDLLPEILKIPTVDIGIKKLAQLSRFGQLLHMNLGLLWPFSNRDVVLEAKGVDMLNENTVVILADQAASTEVEWDVRYGTDTPLYGEEDGIQRMQQFPSGGMIRIAGAKHLVVSGLFRVDPKLAVVPTSLINFLTRTLTHTGADIVRRHITTELVDGVFAQRKKEKQIFYKEIEARFLASSLDEKLQQGYQKVLETLQFSKPWEETSIGKELAYTPPSVTTNVLATHHIVGYLLFRSPSHILHYLDHGISSVTNISIRQIDGFFKKAWYNLHGVIHEKGIYFAKERLVKLLDASSVQTALSNVNVTSAFVQEYPRTHTQTEIATSLQTNPKVSVQRAAEQTLANGIPQFYQQCNIGKDGCFLTYEQLQGCAVIPMVEDHHYIHVCFNTNIAKDIARKNVVVKYCKDNNLRITQTQLDQVQMALVPPVSQGTDVMMKALSKLTNSELHIDRLSAKMYEKALEIESMQSPDIKNALLTLSIMHQAADPTQEIPTLQIKLQQSTLIGMTLYVQHRHQVPVWKHALAKNN